MREDLNRWDKRLANIQDVSVEEKMSDQKDSSDCLTR